MAKEQWHNWGRTLIILFGIVFAGGGYAMKIIGHEKAIQAAVRADEKILTKVDKNGDEIVTLKLQYKDIENLSSNTNEILKEIKESGRKTLEYQMEQRVEIAEIKKDVGNLIGVD